MGDGVMVSSPHVVYVTVSSLGRGLLLLLQCGVPPWATVLEELQQHGSLSIEAQVLLANLL